MKDSSKETRWRHSAEFKAQILGECAQPAGSVASVALSHGINANVVYKWRRLAHAGAKP
jgi:transposase